MAALGGPARAMDEVPAFTPPVSETAPAAGAAVPSGAEEAVERPAPVPGEAAIAQEAGRPALDSATSEAVPPMLEEGEASWYGRRFHGRRTASGERFDMTALTAAHPWLPFGTRVRVRHVETGAEVEVRINDRGPFRGARIIDLSRAAARALGLAAAGAARVRLWRLDEGLLLPRISP